MADRLSGLDEYRRAIEQSLDSAVDPSNLSFDHPERYAGLMTMLRYHLGWVDPSGRPAAADVGKRMRPLMLLIACQAAGGDWPLALPAAAAVELVHNFSLIHDDIEDASSERRGRPTVWKLWGIPQAINTGDSMFVLARMALNRLEVDGQTSREIHGIFDRATLGVTQGQYLDLGFEKRDAVTIDEYLGMVKGKTAALLAACASIGGRLATENQETVEALFEYGASLGIAFQIVDDILGIWGDPGVTGKPAGDDLRAKKKSLPVLVGLESDPRGVVREFLRGSEITEAGVARALEALELARSRERSEQMAQEYFEAALAALDRARLIEPGRTQLAGLASSAVRREK